MLQAVATARAQKAPPRMFGWASVDCPRVSAVLAPADAPLTMNVYLSYLTDRVREMLKSGEMPEQWMLVYLTNQLEQADLLSQRPNLRNPDEALNDLIFSNDRLHDRLSALNAFPSRITLSKDSPRARQLVEQTSLEQWISALTEGLDEHLM